MSTNQAAPTSEKVHRLSIEGSVILKRKTQWVKRVAKIEECIFSYKNSVSDIKDKMKIDLRVAKIMLGQRDQATGEDPYIYIQANPLKP